MRIRETIWHQKFKRPYMLQVRIFEGAGQTVVFLHGLGAKSSDWEPAIEQLDNAGCRPVAIDLLGFGESPKPQWATYSVDDHAKSVARTIKKLKIKKPVVLVGHSMGAVVCARVARLFPKLVSRAILYEVPAYSNLPTKNLHDFRNRAYQLLFSRITKNPRLTVKTLHYLGRVASDFMDFRLDGNYWIPFERSLHNTVMQDSVYRDISSIQCPIDIVYGRYDLIVIKKSMKKFSRNIQNVRFHQVNEAHRITARTGRILNKLLKEDHINPTSAVR